MARIESWYKQDLKKPVPIRRMETVFNQDALGHLFGVEVYSNGEAVTLAGSVTGYCLLADGTTVPVSGTRSANRASIVIPQTAYSVIGPITITVKLTEGSAITTLLAVVGVVARSRSGQQVNPGSTITDWTNQISEALQDVEDASAAQDAKISDLKSALNDLCSFGELNLANVDIDSFTLIKGTQRTQNIRFPAIDSGKYILSYDITDSSDNDIAYSVDVFYGENPSAVRQSTINKSVSGKGRYAETFTASDGITRLYFYIRSDQSNDAEISVKNIKIQKFDDKYNNTEFAPYQFAVDYGARESILRLKYNIITPEDFGAVGDGETDDTTSVQAAIDAAIDGHKNLFFNQYAIYAVGGIVISDGTLSIDFNGCTLKGLTSDPVIDINPDSYITSKPNGYIKNVNIDMNNIAAYGIKVTYIWRKILDTIAINNPPVNGIGLYVYGQSSCAGNLFSKFRGKGSSNSGTIFMKTDASDNTFDNCDFSNYQIGFEINRFSVVSNFHGFVTETSIYSNSVFVDISAPAQMSNMYPDTQRYAFWAHSNDAAVTISNLVLVFNESAIPVSITTNNPPYFVRADNGATIKKWAIANMSVNSAIYDDYHMIYGDASLLGINIISFTVNANNSTYNIHRPGIVASSATNNALFNSALKNNLPTLYQEGYHDLMIATDNIESGTVIAAWTKYKAFVPYPGIYSVIIEKQNSDIETALLFVAYKNEQYEMSANYNIETGDKVFINTPVLQRSTSYSS